MRIHRAAVGLSALAVTSCHPSPPPAPPPERASVGVVVLKAQPVSITTELPGRATPFQTSEVRPQVGGIVLSRPFHEGSEVRQGQLLYQVDPAPFRAGYEQAAAQLASAEAAVETAKVKADRYAGLVKINGVAKQEYDDAVAAYRQAKAAVAQQRAQLNAARINLGWASIRAPISGRIGVSTVTEGALVSPGQTAALTVIQRLDPIYVNISEPSVDLLRLRKAVEGGEISEAKGEGVPVTLKLEDGSTYPFPGRLQFTDVTVDQATDAVTLKAIFPNPKHLLLPGMFVEAVFSQGVNPAGLLAPEQGVARDEKGQPTALVVSRAGKVEFRSLRTSAEIGNQWLVTEGLSPGDHLIVEGVQRVKPGDSVVERPARLVLNR